MRIIDLPAARHRQVRGFDLLRDFYRARGELDELPGILAEQATWRDAELYWVTEPMTRLALDVAYDMPAWTVAAALPVVDGAPVVSGLLFYDGGLPALPILTDEPSKDAFGRKVHPESVADYVRWWPDERGFAIEYGCLAERAPDKAIAEENDFVPMGQLTFPRNALDRTLEPADVRDAGMFGDAYLGDVLMLLGCTWVLMGQESASETRREVQRPTSKQAKRGVKPTTVTTVTLRRMRHVVKERDANGRQYTHQWVVRPYWRQQPWGPNGDLRRPILIPAHTKGPVDAPFMPQGQREIVRVWRR